MGQQVTVSMDRWRNPDYAPDVTMPPVFDPLGGFPQGRKKREMIATWQEMDDNNLLWYERDYCAHTFIAWRKCVLTHYPITSIVKCKHVKHAHETCRWEDFILRMKEYERERRLKEREVKLQRKAENEAAAA